MRLRLITLLTLITFFSNIKAQLPIDEKTGKVIYTDIITLEGMSKDDIYDKAKLWVVSTLKSGDNMIELDGSNSDKIIATGNIELTQDQEKEKIRKLLTLNKGYLNFKFLIYCKDNRMKYEVKNFHLVFSRTASNTDNYPELSSDLISFDKGRFSNKHFVMFKDYATSTVDANIKALVSDFIQNMKSEPDDNW